MKKTLIAMAVLATAGVASAEVTLYGRLDLGVVDAKKTTADEIVTVAGGATTTVRNITTTEQNKNFAGNQHGRNTSRLGVTGTENLGNGLTAFFNYEFKLEPDNTSTGSAAGTTRLANLGLKGGFGEVKIGTFLNDFDAIGGYTPATYSVGGGDFFYNLRTGTYLKSIVSGYGDGISEADIGVAALSVRSTNALSFTSPSFGGFTVGAVISSESSNKDTVNSVSAVTTPIKSESDSYILAFNYNNGPLATTLVYGNKKRKQTATETATLKLADLNLAKEDKVDDIAIAVKYDLGFAVPYVGYEQIKYDLDVADFTNNAGITTINGYNKENTKAHGWELGSSFPMGAFTPYVVFSMGKFDLPPVTDTTIDADVKGWQLGTTYDLSKRTSLYASYGEDKSKLDTRTTTTAGGVTTVTTQSMEAKNKGFALGLIHKF